MENIACNRAILHNTCLFDQYQNKESFLNRHGRQWQRLQGATVRPFYEKRGAFPAFGLGCKAELVARGHSQQVNTWWKKNIYILWYKENKCHFIMIMNISNMLRRGNYGIGELWSNDELYLLKKKHYYRPSKGAFRVPSWPSGAEVAYSEKEEDTPVH